MASIHGSTLSTVFINDLDRIRIENTLSKFAADRKLGGVVDMTEGCAAIQRDPNRLEKWAEQKPHEVQQVDVQSPPSGEEH